MKILIIRLSSIGDIVLTSPLLRCLKRQWPDAELHMMVKSPFAPVVEQNPHLARILLYGQPVQDEYDYVVDLQCNARSRRICRRLSAQRLTFRKQNFAKLLLTLFKREIIPVRHVCDRYLEAVRPLGVENDGQGLEFHIDSQFSIPNSQLSISNSQFSILVVGANHRTKTIPLPYLQQLAAETTDPVVLLGGKQEAALTASVQWPDHVLDLCGKTTLQESAALLRAARHVVCPDTGMMHMAVALGVPVTLLWGSTDPRYGFAPYQPHGPVRQLIPSCRCHPCGKLGHDRCPLGHFRCMQEHFEAQSSILNIPSE